MKKVTYRVRPETAMLTRGFDPRLSVGAARPPVYRGETSPQRHQPGRRRDPRLPSNDDHAQRASEAELARMGITPGLVRVSIGTEHWKDLLADLESALS